MHKMAVHATKLVPCHQPKELEKKLPCLDPIPQLIFSHLYQLHLGFRLHQEPSLICPAVPSLIIPLKTLDGAIFGRTVRHRWHQVRGSPGQSTTKGRALVGTDLPILDISARRTSGSSWPSGEPSTLRQRSLSKGRWVCVSARCTRNALGSALSPKKHSSPGHEGAIAAAKRPLGLARRPVRPKALGFGLETAKAFAHQSSFEEDHFRGRLIDQRCIAGV